jgi:hypothetical protein
MTEIIIGVRISRENGIRFFGIEEVNEALKRGACVVSVAPGDVVMMRTGESEGKVKLAFGGYNMKLTIKERDEGKSS